MGARIRPKNKNIGKKGIKKQMRKFDAKKKTKPNISADFRGFWVDVLGVAGGRGEDFIADISRHLPSFDTRDPGGVRRTKMGAKIHPK